MTRDYLLGTCIAGVAGILLVLTLDATRVQAQNAEIIAPLSMEETMNEGASLYRYKCAKCHGGNGEGLRNNTHDAAPPLVGHPARMSVSRIAVQVIRGGAYMPPFASLTDREIAAVVTYVRNSFGNDYGPATAEEVAALR